MNRCHGEGRVRREGKTGTRRSPHILLIPQCCGSGSFPTAQSVRETEFLRVPLNQEQMKGYARHCFGALGSAETGDDISCQFLPFTNRANILHLSQYQHTLIRVTSPGMMDTIYLISRSSTQVTGDL
jgi:hypothetical protein